MSDTLVTDKPHRLSQGRILEMLLARNVGASESVTLRLNAKGETQPEVTAVVLDGETLSDAADRAQQIYDRLREHVAIVEGFLPDPREDDLAARSEALSSPLPSVEAGDAA